jgi:hypothetical protein
MAIAKPMDPEPLPEEAYMFRKALRHLSIFGALLALPAIASAGANTWTGGNAIPDAQTFSLVAADPSDPYVVYGTFSGALHRSRDGGRTWAKLRFFGPVQALLVHPADPSTIYVAGFDDELFSGKHFFKSIDAGETWTPVNLDPVFISALAGSPTDPSIVFAGTWGGWIYKTTDGGATWTGAGPLYGVIASLVLDRREPAIAYAGSEGVEYWGFNPGSLTRTTDGGMSWQPAATPDPVESSTAVAVDAVASSTVYAAVGPARMESTIRPNVLRSEDGGASWVSAGSGLPTSIVRSLVTDPRVSGALYAGTDAGIFRSRDAGRSWTPFGQQLAGVSIRSLATDGEGRFLHAGTNQGVYSLEIVSGPLDVAAKAAGASRLLSWGADRLSVGTLDASGNWTAGPAGDPSATWTATAIATAPDGSDRTHVLWQCGDGRSAIEIVGASGQHSKTVFAAAAGWMPSDLSVRGDGKTSVLWTSTGARMRIATVDSSGSSSHGPEYGPAAGWSAVAIADGSDGYSRVLWRASDGRSALSLHRDGAMLVSRQWAADPHWAAEDIAVGADGRPRLLRTSPDGTAEVSTVAVDGTLGSAQEYGSPGFTPRRIAAGPDGLTRLLFSGAGGAGDLVVLRPDNTLHARQAIPAANAAKIAVTTVARARPRQRGSPDPGPGR